MLWFGILLQIDSSMSEYASEESADRYTVEHLERCISNESKMWRHPLRPDIQTVHSLQILPCNILGSWNLQKRAMTFDLENWEMIDVLFRSFYC